MGGQNNLCGYGMGGQSYLLAQQQAAGFSALQQLAGLGNYIKRERTYKDDIKDIELELKSYLYGETNI